MKASRAPLLVLTGFMGTGKTAVGRILAARLGRDFIDMDARIEEEEGMSISGIFERRGETYFRALEAECCARLAQMEDAVISTGGGALVDPANLVLFGKALVVCLDADPAEIFERLRHERNRPLLEGPDPRGRIAELLSARREAYARIPCHVDTKAKTVGEVADEIAALLPLLAPGPSPDAGD